jgi:hypothetical protein
MDGAVPPLGLVLRENFALRVVANVADVDVAADVELFGAELGHFDSVWDVYMLGEGVVDDAVGFVRSRLLAKTLLRMK